MRSWTQLESDFRALRASDFDARLVHQSGAAGEHWRVAAAASVHARTRFEALARMGGEKILELPATGGWPDIAQESDPLIRWYRGLRQLSGAYRTDGHAIQEGDEAGGRGVLLMATIQDVYEASATLCATLESLATAPRRRAELLCAVPRYSGPCKHWKSAQSLLSAEEPDYARAAHESISAVEGLCRIILAQSTFTLGDALKRMRRGADEPSNAAST